MQTEFSDDFFAGVLRVITSVVSMSTWVDIYEMEPVFPFHLITFDYNGSSIKPPD